MKGEQKFSPVMGRFQDAQSSGRRGMKGEEVGWWLREWREVRWGTSLPYRRPGRDTSSRGLAADTCVLASDTCLCN